MSDDPVSAVFGYVLIAAAAALAFRERHAYVRRGADAWLITRRRYRRRMLVSLVLAGVGALIAAWGHGSIDFRDPETGIPDPGPFTVFVFALTGLSLFLMILAVIDVADTARNATKHTLEELALPPDQSAPLPNPEDDKRQEL